MFTGSSPGYDRDVRRSASSAPPRRALAVAALIVVAALSACGGGGKSETPEQKAGDAAVAARQIPQGITITHTETGTGAVSTGSEMTPLKTYAAAKRECGYWHAWYVGKVYGPGLDPNLTPTYLKAVAHSFAVHRAAPGDLADVQQGCRAGLHA